LRVINLLSAHIAILSTNGEIVAVNDAWRAFGRRNGLAHPTSGVGQNYLTICDTAAGERAGEASCVAEGIRRVARGDADEFRIEYSCHSGTERRWFQLRSRRFDRMAEDLLIVKHLDVTEAKVAEAAARTAQDQLAICLGQLEVAVREQKCAKQELQQQFQALTHVGRLASVGELSAQIAHEINQPLAAIASYVFSARERANALGPGGERIGAILTRALEQSDRTRAIISRLRGLAKRIPPQQCVVSVNEVVEDVHSFFDCDSRFHNVRFETEFASGELRAPFDRIQIQQVLINLIMNALDAITCVEPEHRRIVVQTARVEPKQIRVSVRDFGCGLNHGACLCTFEPFCTSKPQGMGIGLSICKSIIEEHGGQIGLDPGEPGCTAWFTLPALIVP